MATAITKASSGLVPVEVLQNKILLIRGKKVMLDRDLAELYGVETRILNQAVRRNQDRFPEDFVFQLDSKESERLRSQSVISNRGGSRYLPLAFTEQWVAMLSSVLNTTRAIQVNVQIMRTFVRLREMIQTNEMLRRRIEDLERKFEHHAKDSQSTFIEIFTAIEALTAPPPPKPRKSIGF